MRSSKSVLLAIALAVPAIAAAQQPPVMGAPAAAPPGQVSAPSGVGGHAETVETLLTIDSRLAMEKMNERAAKAAPPAPASAPMAPTAVEPPETIEVVAVLGIGDAKKATILISGKRHSQLVVGSKAGKYVVRQIGGGCVDLEVSGKAPKAVPKQALAKAKPGKGRLKHVCFDPDAEYEPSPGAGGVMAGQGGGTINTRMTVAPLPLPMVPAVRVNPM